MPFEFSLAAVLKYRESIEQREQLALEKLQQTLVVVEKSIRAVEEACSLASQKRAMDMKKGMVAAEVRSAYDFQVALERHREMLRAQWEALKVQWRRQLQSYETAHRKRETIERLRSRQFEAYKLEQGRREQRAVDDAFLSRRKRRE